MLSKCHHFSTARFEPNAFQVFEHWALVHQPVSEGVIGICIKCPCWKLIKMLAHRASIYAHLIYLGGASCCDIVRKRRLLKRSPVYFLGPTTQFFCPCWCQFHQLIGLCVVPTIYHSIHDCNCVYN